MLEQSPGFAVELQQLVVLGGQRFVGLAQCHLQLLDLLLVPALLALLAHRRAVVLQRLEGVSVLLRRTGVGTSHISRFGDYTLDPKREAGPIDFSTRIIEAVAG